jgi:hypothetical protein
MPTSRKRHTVTETPNVEQALAPLRASGISVDLPELVIKGAGAKLDEARKATADDARRRTLRERFLKNSRAGGRVDLEVALKVREDSWIEGS